MLTLSNDGLITAVRLLVKEERRITREILDLINEVSRRRLFADLGYSSIFDWLVKDLGYSESAAYRRMQAARLLQAVPEIAGKLESGVLGLTMLSKVQTLIRADEKRTGERISTQEKSEILSKVESCSGREAEHRLAVHFPDLAMAGSKEKVRAISEDQVRVQVTFTREQFEKLKRIEELLSHTHNDASNAALLDAAMDVFLEKKDPLKKKDPFKKKDALKKIVPPRPALCDTAAEVTYLARPNPNATSTRNAMKPLERHEMATKPSTRKTTAMKPLIRNATAVTPLIRNATAVTPSTRNAVFRKSGGRCEYRDPKTNRRCESRHFLEIDHVQPRALGGTNAADNLRTLCGTHNLLMAEQIFGREKIEAFRRRL